MFQVAAQGVYVGGLGQLAAQGIGVEVAIGALADAPREMEVERQRWGNEGGHLSAFVQLYHLALFEQRHQSSQCLATVAQRVLLLGWQLGCCSVKTGRDEYWVIAKASQPPGSGD